MGLNERAEDKNTQAALKGGFFLTFYRNLANIPPHSLE
jgi:hypothetical protein